MSKEYTDVIYVYVNKKPEEWRKWITLDNFVDFSSGCTEIHVHGLWINGSAWTCFLTRCFINIENIGKRNLRV